MNIKEFEKKLELYRNTLNKLILNDISKRKPKSLYDPLVYFLKSSGKRLRGILVLLVSNLVNGKQNDLPYNQAIAVELLHNFTLIHDDIMDNSNKRHNKLTLHVKYDLSTAILAGDTLLAIAYEFLDRDLKINQQKIYEEFTKALSIVCEGQALDKEFETRKKVTIPNYFEMISKKTGALIKTACRIGALLNTNNNSINIDLIENLGNFGLYTGIAFQIQDDLLDVIGNQKLFGKTKGTDLIEGKKTYLLLNALKKAKGKDLIELQKIIENKGIKPSSVKKYIDIYYRTGVIEQAKEEINKHFENAKKILSTLSKNYNVNNLELFLNYVINRRY